MPQTIFVQTFGCQMNERDSEEVLGMLGALGYERAEQPEAADVILVNTCSVREHAEERALGRIGELSGFKRQNPSLVLGVIGCMAKLQQETIFKRVPGVDLIAGPAELYDLPMLLAEIYERRRSQSIVYRPWSMDKTIAVGRTFRPLELKPAADFRRDGVTAFVTIMEGCDKACAYCIVPKTRGAEVSRPAEEIIEEIRGLAEAGYQEVTLLGQNVNSYGKRFPDGSGYQGPLGRRRLLEEDPDALLDFPALLRKIEASFGEKRGQTPIGVRPRVRFTTSHPIDATDRLFEAMRDCDSVCEWLHLPVQSGSNRILRAMRRGYTAEAYLRKIEAVRRLVPDVSLSTDLIIGFPGETDEDFQATRRLVREVGFDNVYIFHYSPRPGTDAAAREDDVPPEVKRARLTALLAEQQAIGLARQQALVGQEVEILIEALGTRAGQWFGRMRGHFGVIIESEEPLRGRRLPVTITSATPRTLFGTACR